MEAVGLASRIERQRSVKSVSRPGITFEDRVADILQALDPTCRVSRREHLRDRLGHDREFDIVLRGKLAGQELVGVVECKDHIRKTAVPEIEAFVTKAADLRANMMLYASKRGFTRHALEKARHYGVGTLSLFPDGTPDDQFTLGVRWYVVHCQWVMNAVVVSWADGDSKPFDPWQLRYEGRRVVAWWARKLRAAGNASFKANELEERLVFARAVPFETGAGVRNAVGVQFRSVLKRTVKTRMVRVFGQGLIWWHKDQLVLPSKSSMTVQFADSPDAGLPNLDGWEETEDLPDQHNFGLHMEVWATPAEGDEPAPELEKLTILSQSEVGCVDC